MNISKVLNINIALSYHELGSVSLILTMELYSYTPWPGTKQCACALGFRWSSGDECEIE